MHGVFGSTPNKLAILVTAMTYRIWTFGQPRWVVPTIDAAIRWDRSMCLSAVWTYGFQHTRVGCGQPRWVVPTQRGGEFLHEHPCW